jgi:hypothetical protein
MVSTDMFVSEGSSADDGLMCYRDKVLIRALYFAEQQHLFEKMMKSFGSDDTSAANLGYGYCRLLLEVCCFVLAIPMDWRR